MVDEVVGAREAEPAEDAVCHAAVAVTPAESERAADRERDVRAVCDAKCVATAVTDAEVAPDDVAAAVAAPVAFAEPDCAPLAVANTELRVGSALCDTEASGEIESAELSDGLVLELALTPMVRVASSDFETDPVCDELAVDKALRVVEPDAAGEEDAAAERDTIDEIDMAAVAAGEVLAETEALAAALTEALRDSDAEGVREPHAERLALLLVLGVVVADAVNESDTPALAVRVTTPDGESEPFDESDAAAVAADVMLAEEEALAGLLIEAVDDIDGERVDEPHAERLAVPLALFVAAVAVDDRDERTLAASVTD